MSIAEEFQSALGAAGQSYERQMQRPGLSLAVVTNINDEEKLNRVKCLPIENENKEETDWCYVMAPLGGKQCGQFFFPNVNDLVVLGYLGGDPHRPIVLGAYWTTQFPPPYTIQDGKVYNFSIKTNRRRKNRLLRIPAKTIQLLFEAKRNTGLPSSRYSGNVNIHIINHPCKSYSNDYTKNAIICQSKFL